MRKNTLNQENKKFKTFKVYKHNKIGYKCEHTGNGSVNNEPACFRKRRQLFWNTEEYLQNASEMHRTVLSKYCRIS